LAPRDGIVKRFNLSAPTTAGAANVQNNITLSSFDDGDYKFRIDVRAPVVTNIQIYPVSTVSGLSGSDLGTNAGGTYFWSGRSEEPGVGQPRFTFPHHVGYAISQVKVVVTSTGTDTNTIYVNDEIVLASPPSAGVTTAFVSLRPGQNNVIKVINTNDGNYLYDIYRNNPVITNVEIHVGQSDVSLASPALLFNPVFDPRFPALTAGDALVAGVPSNIGTYIKVRFNFSNPITPIDPAAVFSYKWNGTVITPSVTNTGSTDHPIASGTFDLPLLLNTNNGVILDNVLEITSSVDGTYRFKLLGAVVTSINIVWIDPTPTALNPSGTNVPVTYSPTFTKGVTSGYVVDQHIPNRAMCLRVSIQYPSITVPGAPTSWLNSNSSLGLVTLTPGPVTTYGPPVCTLIPGNNVLTVTHPIDGLYQFTVYREPSANTLLTSLSIGSGAETIPARVFTIAQLGLSGFSPANHGPYAFTLANNVLGATVTITVGDNNQGVSARLTNSRGTVTNFPSLLTLTGLNAPNSQFGTYYVTLNSLTTGVNTLVITVTAADGVTQDQYTILITRLRSTNAFLKTLVFYGFNEEKGTQAPVAFDRLFIGAPDPWDPTPYVAKVASGVTAGVLQLTAADPVATIQISAGGQAFVPYNGSLPSHLSEGTTSFIVLVTAESGFQRIYEVDVTRAARIGYSYVPGPWTCTCPINQAPGCPSTTSVQRVPTCVRVTSGSSTAVDIQNCLQDPALGPTKTLDCMSTTSALGRSQLRALTYSVSGLTFPAGNGPAFCQC